MKYIKKIFLLIITLFVLLSVTFINNVFANEIDSVSVIEDLSKDETFNVNDYKSYTYEEVNQMENVNIFDVISIAESSDCQLYIYVYNPTKIYSNFKAYQISLYDSYCSNPDDFTPMLYDLELISSSNTLEKYLVKDYTISSENNRYYNIVEISRLFDEKYDSSLELGSTNDIAYSIGKQWYCYYYNDQLIYEMEKFNTLELDITLNGNVYYENGVTWDSIFGKIEKCNSHFVAFNPVNFKIDKIYDADLSYYPQVIEEYDDLLDNTKDKILSISNITCSYIECISIKNNDYVEFVGNGLYSKTYKWDRILSSTEFINNFESQGGVLNIVSKEKLLDSEYVFAYKETDYIEQRNYSSELGVSMLTSRNLKYTQIAKLDILRVSFLSEEKFYNLGVVANKTTSDNVSDGINGLISFFDEFIGIIKLLIQVILAFIIIYISIPILKVIINIIVYPFKFIFKKNQK